MGDLIAFLAARLDEDEANVGDVHDRLARDLCQLETYGQCSCAYPACALRKVEAGRAIVAVHNPARHPDSPRWCPVCITGRNGYAEEWDDDPYPCLTLRHLAAVYSSHPDYLQEWRP